MIRKITKRGQDHSQNFLDVKYNYFNSSSATRDSGISLNELQQQQLQQLQQQLLHEQQQQQQLAKNGKHSLQRNGSCCTKGSFQKLIRSIFSSLFYGFGDQYCNTFFFLRFSCWYVRHFLAMCSPRSLFRFLCLFSSKRAFLNKLMIFFLHLIFDAGIWTHDLLIINDSSYNYASRILFLHLFFNYFYLSHE